MPDNNVRALRRKKGMTQKALADAAGTTQQSIQRIEAGLQSARFDVAAKICRALGHPIGDVFPSAALPMKRAKKQMKSGGMAALLNDEKSCSELEAAGLDMDCAVHTFRYRLRGGASGDLDVSGSEKSRLWALIQDDNPDGFAVFDAGARRYALNLDHLTFCHFLFDPPQVAGSEEVEEADLDARVEVYMADSSEPLCFDVEPDTVELGKDEPPPGTADLQYLFMDLEMSVEGRFKFTDIDGETAWFRSKDVALISVPLEAVEPRLLEIADDESDAADDADAES
jgi:DNA-binding XRE family transcriptional regulator